MRQDPHPVTPSIDTVRVRWANRGDIPGSGWRRADMQMGVNATRRKSRANDTAELKPFVARRYREWRAKTRSKVGEACCALTVSPVLMTEAFRLSRTKYASSAQAAPWVAPQ